MTKSKIEWTDRVWNPVTGCTAVSPGCDNCYAENIAHRFAGTPAFPRGFRVTLRPERLDAPLRWRKPSRIFLDSMFDLFHEDVPDEYIARVFAVMVLSPQHTYQVLTKRHGRMRSLLNDQFFRAAVRMKIPLDDRPAPGELAWPLPNVWLGVSVEDQKRADLRIPALLDTPAAVRFLSCEPLLGPVDLRPWLPGADCPGCGRDVTTEVCSTADAGAHQTMATEAEPLSWVIVGGESGAQARPMHPDWARQLRDQCTAVGVPFFFKQWGEHQAAPLFDAPTYASGRAFRDPRHGSVVSASIRERGPSRTFRSGPTRPLRAGDVNGYGQMLDDDTIAVRVGKKAAGRELDGRTWDQFPTTQGRR